MPSTTPIYPCIWFDDNANEAAKIYCSIFKNSGITSESPVVTTFELAGQPFMALNGGPTFKPNPSISFSVQCDSDDEINSLWNALSQDGSILMPLDSYEWSDKYGWVQDRFGVNWQLSITDSTETSQKITPSFLFTGAQFGNAEKAMLFYTSVFENSEITSLLKYTDNGIEAVKHAQFKLANVSFTAMDSSLDHDFQFNEGVSLVVHCENQEEIDFYWNTLTKDGSEQQCGWLKDQFGISWQIVPDILSELMNDEERAPRVIQAFMKMTKLDIKALESA